MAKVDTTDWGTFKRTSQTSIYNTTPGGASTVTVSAASYVPVGTKAIRVRVDWTTAAVGRNVRIEETGTGNANDILDTAVAAQRISKAVDVQLDANLAFDVTFSAAASSFNLIRLGVWL